MKDPGTFYCAQKRSSAIVLTLLILVLISIIVLGLLASVTLEKQITESNYQQRRALGIAMYGFQSGVAQLRSALGTGTNSWDNPYANFATNPPTFFWSVSPGLLTRWSYTQSTPQTNIALFSQSFDNANTNLVNLNRPLADGSTPIIGGANPPSVTVQFVNVLQNPSLSASAGNPIIGRFAFWIDDESAKINVNVADGTQKYTTNSLGLGYPTEVSLQVLSQGGSPLTQQEATNIVQMARTNGFHSPREILRVSGTTPDLYTNNVFNVTDYSRSPDINIFGQPKMAMLPILGNAEATESGTNMVINGISLQAENEIYPTPSQLPPYYVFDYGVGRNVYYADTWPLAFRAQTPATVLGQWGGQTLAHDYVLGLTPNHPYNNGALMANYMAGTNAAGMPITWPLFQNASAQGFRGKYSNRQIDEIAIQAISLSAKLTSSDYAYPLSTDYPSINVSPPYLDATALMQYPGYHYDVAPFIWAGWLSRQFVIGMGRAPRVSRLALTLAAYGAQGTVNTPGYTPPTVFTIPWIEEWIPGAYRTGLPATRGTFMWGLASLNATDMAMKGTQYPRTPAYIPKSPPDSSGNTNSYWGNQLLTNNQGLDITNNQKSDYTGTIPYPDPDQILAQQFHDPWALSPVAPSTIPTALPYLGAAPNSAHSTMTMNNLQAPGDAEEWGVNTDNPGGLRCVQFYDAFLQSYFGLPLYLGSPFFSPLKMQSSAGSVTNPTLTFGGGLSVHASVYGAYYFSDPNPVPLESIRGQVDPVSPATLTLLSGALSVDTIGGVPSWNATNGMTGSPAGTILRDRHVASVIPVNVSLTVPAPNSLSGTSTNVYFYTPDPMVNEFPGDWVQAGTINSPFPTPVNPPTAPGGYGYQYYSETNLLQNIVTQGGDPDSFWIPQVEPAYSAKSQLASQTLFPRSARMPNIGYLQYIRTGIIPDDETLPYSPQPGQTPSQYQHGTPFRLFSYGPSGDSSQTVRGVNYPDWALLDLFYVPSILYSFGGPYASNTNLAPFGTYGGATAGRINPNGCVMYTTNVSTPSGIIRTLPLQATLYGLHVNQSYSGTVDHPEAWGYSDVAGSTILDAGGSSTLAGSIAQYIHDNGPLRMPGEICNIPAVTALKASENALGTRNDLVRQMVGELTTQSNVFSVWTVGQAIQKIPRNTQYGEFEAGDLVLSEVRFHFVVERYLDPGADGVYGNSKNPGVDGVVGSFDDPVDANHPFEPRYLYRVVRSEELR